MTLSAAVNDVADAADADAGGVARGRCYAVPAARTRSPRRVSTSCLGRPCNSTYWLRLPQRVDSKVVAVMAFRVLHGLAPPYLNDLVRVADLPGRRRLRSSSSHQLLVPPFRLTTVGGRTFPVAASLLCNSLPSHIQSSSSLPVFRRCLKTFLFVSLLLT